MKVKAKEIYIERKIDNCTMNGKKYKNGNNVIL